MSAVGAYILSVVGIVFLGVLVDVIMPEGSMNKFVKGMFSLVALFVIVSPLKLLFDKNFDIGNVFYDNASITIDQDFLDATNKQIKKKLENAVVVSLKDDGYDEVSVEVCCFVLNGELQIEKVVVDISKMVINSDLQHINKYTQIKALVSKYLNVEESDVIINE